MLRDTILGWIGRDNPLTTCVYPLLPDRFLWKQLQLHEERTAGVEAAVPDISGLVETPISRAFADIASRNRGHQV